MASSSKHQEKLYEIKKVHNEQRSTKYEMETLEISLKILKELLKQKEKEEHDIKNESSLMAKIENEMAELKKKYDNGKNEYDSAAVQLALIKIYLRNTNTRKKAEKMRTNILSLNYKIEEKENELVDFKKKMKTTRNEELLKLNAMEQYTTQIKSKIKSIENMNATLAGNAQQAQIKLGEINDLKSNLFPLKLENVNDDLIQNLNIK